jgi:hypothetical protein
MKTFLFVILAVLLQSIGLQAQSVPPKGAPMKNAKGQEIRWVLADDFLAYAKEKYSPEKFAEIEAPYKDYCERHKAKSVTVTRKDSEGRVVGSVTHTPRVHAIYRKDHFTDPWTGDVRVFTEEEKKKYGLTFKGDLPPHK